MAKVKYDGITFDSDLEVEYYKHLKEDRRILNFYYHPREKIQITMNNHYTPDFIVEYLDKIVIVETKGYNQFSFMRDNMIHSVMKSMKEEALKNYVEKNGFLTNGKPVIYQKIKYLKTYGWVDYDFKNPNTLSNKRKEKVNTLTEELKNIKKENKDFYRALSYLTKGNLSKSQKEWLESFLTEFKRKVEEEKND